MGIYTSTKSSAPLYPEDLWRSSNHSLRNLIMSPLFHSLTESSSTPSKHQSINENMRSAPSTVNQPIKSAMKKNACNRNIPKGMNGGYIEYPTGDKQHNSNGKSNGNGYISPQYGWYISTTPPTPNYHAHDKANSSSSHKDESGYADSHEKSELVSKPVFQKTMPNYCGGWPTVPL